MSRFALLPPVGLLLLSVLAVPAKGENVKPMEDLEEFLREELDLDRRIINGRNATKHGHPYIASLQFSKKVNSFCADYSSDFISQQLKCFNHRTFQWSNSNYCEYAKEHIYFYYSNGCLKAKQFKPISWKKGKMCKKNKHIYKLIIDKCWDAYEMSSKNDKYCHGFKNDSKDVLKACAREPILKLREQAWEHNCGGVLIKDQWVLTAAHCVEYMQPDAYDRYRVVFGEHSLEDEDEAEDIKEIAEVIINPHYDTLNYQNDIALIKLKSKVVQSLTVKAIKMSDNDEAYVNNKCVLSGWGRITPGDRDYPENNIYANILQEVHITNIPIEECREIMNRITRDVEITDKHICVQSRREETQGASGCNGDSGGPMVCGENFDRLAGITSFGHPFCDGNPSVYTRVSSFREWIDDITKDVAKPSSFKEFFKCIMEKILTISSFRECF